MRDPALGAANDDRVTSGLRDTPLPGDELPLGARRFAHRPRCRARGSEEISSFAGPAVKLRLQGVLTVVGGVVCGQRQAMTATDRKTVPNT
jgi:hypothetical protein